MDLTALASFNRVAKHGGFGQASRSTGQPKATLSRHVRELEAQLKVRLLERGARSVRLTEEGAMLHARIDALLAEIDEVRIEVADGTSHARGQLRVSVPVIFAELMGGKLAAEFASRFPAVALEITAEDRTVDLVEEGYDVVVRINPQPQTDLVGQCFLRDETLVIAPAALRRQFVAPEGQALDPVPAVTLSNGSDAALWREFRKLHGHEIPTRPVLQLPSLVVVRDAVRAGAGIALLPRSIVSEDLAAGCLVSWGSARPRKVEVWVLHKSRRLVSRKVSAFTAFLVTEFSNRT